MKHDMRLVLIGVIFSVLMVGTVTAVVIDGGLEDYEYLKIGDMDVYWQQRMIDDAIVEGDFHVVQFDTETGKLLKEELHWREGLPESITPEITREQAVSMVKGEILLVQLVFISPDSVEFPLDPTPTNPCWVVISQVDERMITTVIDAMDGSVLGYGVSPPYEAYSLGGPDHGGCAEYYYDPWALNAGNWFTTMGYSTEISDRPPEATVEGHVDSATTALFYELAHGGSTNFLNLNTDCGLPTYTAHHIYASDVETWIADRTKMPFTFIGSCGGMCDTGDGSFSYEFRKGSTTDTVTVGYCHMDWTGSPGQTYECRGTCWGTNVFNWQEDLFDYLNQGWTAEAAFNQACADNPMCGDGTTCVRFAGDPALTLVPKIIRGSLPTADAGPDQTVEQTSLAGASISLDGSGSVEPNSATLTYEWSWAGGSATDVNPTITLPLGTTIVTLIVDDGFGSPLDEDLRTDTVSIIVTDTTPPELTVPADVTVEQETTDGTVVPLTATATDICDADITIASDAPAIFPLGDTTVTFTATDDSGNSASGSMVVHVVDTTPPDLTVPADVTVEQETTDGTVVPLTAIASDICDAEVTITSDAPAIFPLGDTTVTFTATDDSGNSVSGSMVVHVVDTTPPQISVTVTPDILWSPNHKMVDITATVTVSDICDTAPVVILTSITSDEPDDGLGDGDTENDIQITTDYDFRLRAERAGTGDGRVYTITYTATDSSSNSASATATVRVPHNK